MYRVNLLMRRAQVHAMSCGKLFPDHTVFISPNVGLMTITAGRRHDKILKHIRLNDPEAIYRLTRTQGNTNKAQTCNKKNL